MRIANSKTTCNRGIKACNQKQHMNLPEEVNKSKVGMRLVRRARFMEDEEWADTVPSTRPSSIGVVPVSGLQFDGKGDTN